jgi:hypothetical protein
MEGSLPMRYRLVKQLTTESILVSTDTGKEVILDRLDLPLNIKESYRLELHNDIRKIGAAEETVAHPGLLKYNGLEKYEDGYYLTRTGSKQEGIAPYQPGDLEAISRDLLAIARMMDAYHRKGSVLAGISLGQLKTGPGGELRLQDPPVINHLSRMLGEPYFFNMPPEVIKGAAWGERSDVFSWGDLAYRLLTGEDPFRAGKSEDRAAKILEGMTIDPRNFECRLSGALSRMIMNCLAPDPNQRPKIATLVGELDGLIQGNQYQATPEVAGLFEERAVVNRRRQQSREKIWMWWRKYGVTALITVAVIAVLVLMGMNRGTPRITSRNKPLEVLNYYFKGIRDVDVSLMDETLYKAKNSLSDTIGNIHVINVSRKANELNMKDDAIKVTVEGLTLEKQAETAESVVYSAKYIVKFIMPAQMQYIDRDDQFTLRPVRKVWRITGIKVLRSKMRTVKLPREEPGGIPVPGSPPANSLQKPVQSE